MLRRVEVTRLKFKSELPGVGSCSFEILLVRHCVRHGGFKSNHRFVGSGVTEFFAGQALESFGVVAKGINLCLELFGIVFLLLELGLQPQNVRAHPLVLMNERHVTHPYQQHKSRDNKGNNNFCQLAPNAEVDVHRAELSTNIAPVKVDSKL